LCSSEVSERSSYEDQCPKQQAWSQKGHAAMPFDAGGIKRLIPGIGMSHETAFNGLQEKNAQNLSLLTQLEREVVQL
jgi:hypothetical protein